MLMWLFIGAIQVIYAAKLESCGDFMRQVQGDGNALLASDKSDDLDHLLCNYFSTHIDLGLTQKD